MAACHTSKGSSWEQTLKMSGEKKLMGDGIGDFRSSQVFVVQTNPQYLTSMMTYLVSGENKVNGGKKEQEKKVFRQLGRQRVFLVCLTIILFSTVYAQGMEHTHVIGVLCTQCE